MARASETYLLDKTCKKLKQFVMLAIKDRSIETYRLPNGEVFLDPEDDHLLVEALANIPAAELYLLAKASGLVAESATVYSGELFRFNMFMGGQRSPSPHGS